MRWLAIRTLQHSTIHRYFIENPNNNHGDLCETLQSSATSKIERLQPGGEQRPTRQTDDSAACLCVCEQAGSSRKFLLRSANVLRRHWPVHQASRLGAEKLAIALWQRRRRQHRLLLVWLARSSSREDRKKLVRPDPARPRVMQSRAVVPLLLLLLLPLVTSV